MAWRALRRAPKALATRRSAQHAFELALDLGFARPVLVDVALVGRLRLGQPAAVLVLVGADPSMLDVLVVGAGCGAGDGQVLARERVPRP